MIFVVTFHRRQMPLLFSSIDLQRRAIGMSHVSAIHGDSRSWTLDICRSSKEHLGLCLEVCLSKFGLQDMNLT